ncbi:hypothetical protein [Gracilibacillus sp. YIM 98692]|uniref:hypothetical protein n=1 Tax=Gracilibacillus sp. YIM 98692 TaxID=2663532 RepID=UPI0013D346B0|nr:hypothetical protein [Gracilibacillus sp. YIM 98692]
MTKQRVGFTKMGFKKPFGCCGNFSICDMGRKAHKCVYAQSDPETMKNCQAYQNQKSKEKPLLVKNKEAGKGKNQEDDQITLTDFDQLSLF